MRVLSVLLAGLLIIFPNGLLYAEVVLDKPMTIVSGARSIRTPQQIIADFQATVDKIQSEQQNLHSQIEVKNKENALLLKKLNDMSIRLTQVQDELAQKSAGIATSADESKTEALIQEKNEILAKYNQVIEEKGLLEQKLNNLKEQRQTLAMAEQESLVKLQKALDASEAKVEEQQAAIDVLIQEKNDIDSKRLEVIEEKTSMEQQLKELQEQIAQAKLKENQKAESYQTPLQLRIRELSDQLDKMENEIRAKDSSISRFKNQAVKAENELRKALLEKENSQEQIQKLTSTYNTAQDGRSEKIARLEKKLEEAQQESKRLTQESATAKKNLSVSQEEQKSLIRKIDALKVELARERTSFDSKLKDALRQNKDGSQNKSQQLDELKQKSTQLSQQLTDMKAERDSLQRSLDALEAGTKLGASKIDPSQGELQSLKVDIENKNRELREKTKEIDELNKEKDVLASQVDELMQDRDDLQDQLSQFKEFTDKNDTKDRGAISSHDAQLLEEKIAKLSRNLKDREEVIEEKESQIKQLKTQHAQASNKLTAAESQKKTLQVMINSLESQLSDGPRSDSGPNQKSALQIAELKGELKARIDETKEAKLSIEKLDRQLGEERKQRESAQKEAAVMQERIKTQEAFLESKIAAKTDPLHETIAKLNAKIKEQSELVQAKEKNLVELKAQKEKIQENLIVSNEERKSLENKIAEFESAQSSLEKAENLSNKTAGPSESDIARELTRKLNEAVEELARKDKQLQEYKDKADRLDQQINGVDTEKSKASQTIEQLNNEIAALKKDSQEKLMQVQEDLEKKIREAQQRAETAEASLKGKEAEVSSLESKLTDLDQQADELSRQNDELRKSSSQGDKLAAGEDKRNALVKEAESLKGRIALLEKERDGYKTQLKDISGESDRLKKDLQAARRSAEDLKISLEKSAKAQEASLKSFAAQKSELESKISTLSAQNIADKKELAGLKEQLAKAGQSAKVSRAGSSDEWKNKYDRVSKELEASLESVKFQEKRANELKNKNEQLQVSVVSFKDDLSKKGKDLIAAEAQKEELAAQVEILTKDRANLDQRVKDLTQQVVNLQAAQSGEITNVKSEATQKTADLALRLADAVGQIQTGDLKIRQLTEKQMKLEEQLAAANSVKDQGQEELQNRLKENDLLRKNYEQQIEQLKQEALRFGSERDAQVMKVNELENAMKDSEKVFEEKQAGLAAEIEKLRGLLTAKDEEMKQVKRNAVDLQKSKEEADAQLSASQAKEREAFEKMQALQSSLTGKGMQSQQESAALEKELRDKIADLNGQLDVVLSEAGELRKSKSALEDGIADKERVITDLQARLTEKEKTLEAKSTKATQETAGVKTALRSEIEKLTSDLKVSERVVGELTKQKGVLEADLKSSQAKVEELQVQVAEKQKIFESSQSQMSREMADSKAVLHAQVKQLSEDLAASQKSVEELSQAKLSLENDLKSKKAVIAQLESEKDEEIKALSSARAQISGEAMSAQKSLEMQIQQLTAQLKASEESLREAQTKNQELEKSNNEMNARLAAAQSLENENREKLRSAQAALADQKAKERETMAMLEKELKGRIDETSAQLAAAKNETAVVQKAKEALEAQIRDKEKSIEDLQARLTEKDKSLEASRSTASQETSEVKAALGAQIQELNAEIQNSRKTIEELTQAKTGLQSDLQASEEKVLRLQEEVVAKQKALASNQDQMAREMEDVKTALQSKIDELSADLKESQQAQNELAKAKAVLEEQFVSVDKKAGDLSGQIAQKENEFSSYKEKSSREMDQVKVALQSEIDRLKADLQKGQQSVQELSAAKAELQDRLKDAQAQAAELQGKAEQRQKDLDSTKAAAAQENADLKTSLQGQIDRLSTELRDAQGAVEELTKTRAQLSANLKDAETQIAHLTTQVQEKERLLADVKSQGEQELAEKEKSFNEQLVGLKDELTQTKDQLSQISQSKEGLERELKLSSEKENSLTADLAEKTKQWEDLSASVPSQISAAKKPLEEKIEGLVKSLGDAQAELKDKQAAADVLNKTISGLERSLAEITSAKEKSQQESAAVKADLEAVRKDMTVKIDEAKKELLEKNVSLENALKNKEAEITTLNQEKEKISSQLAQLATDKQKLQQEIAALKGTIEDYDKSLEKKIDLAKQPLLDELSKLQSMLAEKEQLIEQKAEAFTKLSGELTTVLKGLAVVREERDNLSLRVKPLELQVSAIPNEVAQAKKPLEAENSKLRLELEKVQGMLDVRVQGLEADLEARNAAYNEAVTSRRNLEKDIERLNQASDKLAQENQRMELKLSKKFQEECGVSMEELQKPWKDKIEELKALLDGRDKEIESFKNENARLNQELGGLAPASN